MSNLREFKTLDLFSGCGGLTLGLSMAGNPESGILTSAAAMDNWDVACKTLEKNLGVRAVCESVSGEAVRSLLSDIGSVDVIVGGPPCQGFSTSGKRALDDPRNKLVLAFLEAVEVAKPKVFLMENVSGFKSFQSGTLFREVLERASLLGYTTKSAIVQASHHGVPQRRRRFILVGAIEGLDISLFDFGAENANSQSLPGLEVTTHFDISLNEQLESWNLWDAISDLPSIEAGTRGEDYDKQPQNDLQRYFRNKSSGLKDHIAMGHRPDFVKMMSYVPQGKSALDPEINSRIPEEIRPTKGFPNSYSRLRPNQPSPTITRNFTTPSSANCIHPFLNRALSIREGARLQTFPDWFDFLGSMDDKRLQIGNAVPPLLGKALGEQILKVLNSNTN